MKTDRIIESLAILILIVIGIGARLLTHLPNFTPVAAIGLFGGAYFSRKKAFLLAIFIMGISDVFIGFYDFKLMAVVYLSMILSVLIGSQLKKNNNWANILSYSVFASAVFFILTNFAVWAFSSWYAKDILGLADCYFMGLPFFRNSLLGDLFYATFFFGGYKLIKIFFESKETAGSLKQGLNL